MTDETASSHPPKWVNLELEYAEKRGCMDNTDLIICNETRNIVIPQIKGLPLVWCVIEFFK